MKQPERVNQDSNDGLLESLHEIDETDDLAE